MKTNKEVVEELVKYFLTQDPAIVARLLANAWIDYNRISRSVSLSKEERSCLSYRILMNAQEVARFDKEGPKGDLKPIVYESGGD
jgi:hypothetical protein